MCCSTWSGSDCWRTAPDRALLRPRKRQSGAWRGAKGNSAIYTVIIFIALMVVGAIIAWAGDAIGTRLGRQRASIFGLRPRQSARLVAVVIGGLLPLIGLGVAVAGSEYARIAVFRLQSLLEQQQQLTKRVEEQTQAAERARQEAQEAEKRAESLEAQRQGLEDQVAELQARETALQTRVHDLEARRRELERRNRELEQRVREAEQKVREAEQKLREAEQKLRESEERLKETEEELRENEQKLQVAEKKRDDLKHENMLLENKKRTLEDRLPHLNGRVAEAERKLALAEQHLSSIETKLKLSEQRLTDVMARESAISIEPALFDPGDELRRWVIAGKQTQDQMEGALWELLHLASSVAEAKGVPVGRNNRAVIAAAPVPPGTTLEEVPESRVVRYVASQLGLAGEEQYVVRVLAFRRLFPEHRKQLEVRFIGEANRLLFEEGEVLVATRIPAEASRLQIFERLWILIANQQTSQVRALARARGMLPDAVTGQYGAVTLADLFNAVDEMRALEGMVPVRAVAAKDTYTVGPLMVEIQVGEREEP